MIDRINDAALHHRLLKADGRPHLAAERNRNALPAEYGELPADFVLMTVKIDRETGETLLVYTTQESGRWSGCRFEGSCDWEEAAG